MDLLPKNLWWIEHGYLDIHEKHENPVPDSCNKTSRTSMNNRSLAQNNSEDQLFGHNCQWIHCCPLHQLGLLYTDFITLTSHSLTQDLLTVLHTTFQWALYNAFSKSTNEKLLLILIYFSCSCLTINMVSVVS